MSSLGERLRQARQMLGKMSQSEFSAKIGITQRSYSRYELGQTVPDVAMITKVSEVTGANIQWLITGEGPAKMAPTGETYIFEHYVKPEPAPGEEGKILFFAVETLEEVLTETGEVLQPAQKAEIVRRLYELAKQDEAAAKKPATILRLIKSVMEEKPKK